MPDRPTTTNLARFIQANASYDGGPDTACPKCKHVLAHGDLWFKHTTSLSRKIACRLGFGQRMAIEIQEMLEGCRNAGFPGAKNRLCLEAAQEILERIYA